MVDPRRWRIRLIFGASSKHIGAQGGFSGPLAPTFILVPGTVLKVLLCRHKRARLFYKKRILPCKDLCARRRKCNAATYLVTALFAPLHGLLGPPLHATTQCPGMVTRQHKSSKEVPAAHIRSPENGPCSVSSAQTTADLPGCYASTHDQRSHCCGEH